eukprot:TRINITY_DN93474_c0_g1_i1.p1 TRINITY_DN93474_c0_g1~~TRINITY_DN93474_c0_g1_i1.p1  ORF type:complete len:114 (-),score=1.12 TRINITY_DN93474_c0_g1_i1:176-466(-)
MMIVQASSCAQRVGWSCAVLSRQGVGSSTHRGVPSRKDHPVDLMQDIDARTSCVSSGMQAFHCTVRRELTMRLSRIRQGVVAASGHRCVPLALFSR